jgi:hypothetical protein
MKSMILPGAGDQINKIIHQEALHVLPPGRHPENSQSKLAASRIRMWLFSSETIRPPKNIRSRGNKNPPIPLSELPLNTLYL